MSKSIVWLASYPKSGNTWTRIFLANYFANQDEPLSINKANMFGFGDSAAAMYHKIAGGHIDVHNKRQVLSARGRVLNAIARNGASINFVKTHNANAPAFGCRLIPSELTRSAIYIVRNPLDVSLSFARHYGMTHEVAVESMGRSDCVTPSTEKFVTEYFGSWSDHVFSWSSATTFPVLVVRYEDMLADPVGSFEKIVRHAGLPVDSPRLEKAVRFSRFEELSKQEEEEGFREASKHTERFFAKGKSGQWQTDLDPTLARKIRKQHRKTMKKYGYLE